MKDWMLTGFKRRLKASIDKMVKRNLKKLNIAHELANLSILINVQNSSEIETAKAIHTFDKVFGRWSSCRGGLQQTLDKPINFKFHIFNWFNVVVLISRFIVFIFIDNYYCDLYLANPFSGTKGAKKDALMLFIILLTATVFVVTLFDWKKLVEWKLYEYSTCYRNEVSILKRWIWAIDAVNSVANGAIQSWLINLFAIISLCIMALFFIMYLRMSLVYPNGSQFIIPRTLMLYIFHTISLLSNSLPFSCFQSIIFVQALTFWSLWLFLLYISMHLLIPWKTV